MPGSLECGHAPAVSRMSRGPRSGSRIDAASCGSHKEAGYAIDAGVLPATLVAFRMCLGFVLGGPPGRRMARQPAASCGLTGRAMDDRSAGVLAGGAPTSDNLPDQFAIDRRATAWIARRCAVLGCEARHIRARVGPCPIARSRTRARRQDAADVAQSPAARRAAKNKPSHHPDLHKGSRQDAGVDWRVRLPCASRRTRRRCASLNAGAAVIRAKARTPPD